jgi:hypothetical protein
MKKKLILIFIVFTTTVFSQNISGKVTYVVSMTPITDKLLDSISKKNGKEKMSKFVKSFLKHAPNVNAYLEFANGESIYYVEKKC